jgi:ABC-2 type transport system ATP-binding protein
MTAAIEARRLTKHYGHRSALTDCTLSIPAGRIVGLVGPNGAGKSTLLNLAAGLLTPTSGTIAVLGDRPGAHLARVGFVAQDAPLYAAMSVDDHVRMGAHMNPAWDNKIARHRIAQAGIEGRQRAGRLSGGQRALLALALATGKRPDLLLLDEPVAALDPLARRDFLDSLAEFAAQAPERTVVLSSHVVSDLRLVCDYLIVLSRSQVQIAGPSADLLARHARITGQRASIARRPAGVEVIHDDHHGAIIVRSVAPVPGDAGEDGRIDLETLVLAYMARAKQHAVEGIPVAADAGRSKIRRSNP